MRPIFLKIAETIVKTYKNRPRIGYATGRIFLGKHARAVTYPDRYKVVAVRHPHETEVQPVFQAQEEVTEERSAPVYMAEAVPHYYEMVVRPVFHEKGACPVPACMGAAIPHWHVTVECPVPVYMAEAIPHWHVTVAYPVFHGKVEDSPDRASMAAAAPVFHAEAEDSPVPALMAAEVADGHHANDDDDDNDDNTSHHHNNNRHR